mgnify:FL=1
MYSHSVTAGLVAALALGGCTGKTFEQFDVSPNGRSVSVDATQRFLLVKPNPANTKSDVVVCAEPSPDAAMAVAAQIAGSGVLPSGLQAGLSGARSESLASLGLRTPAIQLVRDMWYRACEGLINGVHDPDQLVEFAKKVDRLIVVLAAIDGISNAPTAPAVAIGSVGGAETSTGTSAGNGTPTGSTTSKAGTSGVTLVIQPGAQRGNVDGAAVAIQQIVRDFLAADMDVALAARPQSPKTN